MTKVDTLSTTGNLSVSGAGPVPLSQSGTHIKKNEERARD